MVERLNVQSDLQVMFDDLRRQIRSNRRQAAGPVRENLRRLGKMKYIMDFATLNKIRIETKFRKLFERVTEDDLAAAATGAGWSQAEAISAMNCEFRLGYNEKFRLLKMKYKSMLHGNKIVKREIRKICKPIRQWTKETKENSKELRELLLED